jgi:hypothetical protein
MTQVEARRIIVFCSRLSSHVSPTASQIPLTLVSRKARAEPRLGLRLLRLDYLVFTEPLAGAARHLLCREIGEVGDHGARDPGKAQGIHIATAETVEATLLARGDGGSRSTPCIADRRESA